eukprot:12166638-Alexandrium_andersonii.AAC.1
MSASLVGSEMCIRDSLKRPSHQGAGVILGGRALQGPSASGGSRGSACSVSYTHLTLPTICSV